MATYPNVNVMFPDFPPGRLCTILQGHILIHYSKRDVDWGVLTDVLDGSISTSSSLPAASASFSTNSITTSLKFSTRSPCNGVHSHGIYTQSTCTLCTTYTCTCIHACTPTPTPTHPPHISHTSNPGIGSIHWEPDDDYPIGLGADSNVTDFSKSETLL